MRKITGKRVSIPDNQPIKFSGKVETNARRIANSFCKQYTSIGDHASRNFKDKKDISKSLKLSHPIDPNFKPFTPDDVDSAIRA